MNEGVEYQKLSVTTGGLRFPVCNFQNYDAVFQAVATKVVQGAQIQCVFDIPKPPDGRKIGAARVEYRPGNGGTVQIFPQVLNSAACGAGSAFYVENNRITLCPSACTEVKSDTMAKVNVLFTCESPIN